MTTLLLPLKLFIFSLVLHCSYAATFKKYLLPDAVEKVSPRIATIIIIIKLYGISTYRRVVVVIIWLCIESINLYLKPDLYLCSLASQTAFFFFYIGHNIAKRRKSGLARETTTCEV